LLLLLCIGRRKEIDSMFDGGVQPSSIEQTRSKSCCVLGFLEPITSHDPLTRHNAKSSFCLVLLLVVNWGWSYDHRTSHELNKLSRPTAYFKVWFHVESAAHV
jgi:hypothetical protein